MSSRALGRSGLVGLAVVLACAWLAAVRAEAAVYWGSNGSIGAANDDGTMPIGSYPYEVANTIPRGGVCGVAVNSTHLFWADGSNQAIGSMQLSNAIDGRVGIDEARVWIDQALVPGVEQPCGVAVDDRHLYWADAAGAIGRSNLDGSAPERGFIDGLDWPCGVAVDGTYVYWGELESQTIGRARLDGSEVDPAFIDTGSIVCGLDATPTHLYWSGQAPNSIGRAGIDGSNPEPNFIPLLQSPCGVAVSSSHVYWANWHEPGTYVSRANLDGSAAAPLVGARYYEASCGVALDSRVFRPRPAPPSMPIRFGPVERLRKGRLLALPVYVPEQGKLTLNSPRIGWRLEKGPVNSPRWTLKLWPGKARPGNRIRRQLRNKGRAPVTLNLTWEHGGRLPIPVTKRLTFVASQRPPR
jgi:virginiamycin B lyase